MKQPQNIDVRVSKLETNINALADNQKALTNDIRDFVKSVRQDFVELHAKIDAWSEKIASHGKINWQALAASFAICTAIVGYYVNSQIGPLNGKVDTTTALVLKMTEDINMLKDHRYTTTDADRDNAENTSQLNYLRDTLHQHDIQDSQILANQVQWETWYNLWQKGLLKDQTP